MLQQLASWPDHRAAQTSTPGWGHGPGTDGAPGSASARQPVQEAPGV